MPAKPAYLVRRPDGREAGALFDLARQGRVGLHVEDEDLARTLADHGIAPARPPLLDAGARGVHGAYAERPQRNWLLAAPLVDVVAELQPILASAGYALSPA